MKRFGCLFFVLFMLAAASTAAAQRRDRNYDRPDMQRQNNGHDLESRHRALNALEREAEKRNAAPDPLTVRRLEIDRNITELGEAGDALVKAAAGSDEKSGKDTAKFADKIAKCTKQLRQNINNGKSVCKIDPSEFSGSDDRSVCMKKLAETIDAQIDEVIKSRYQVGMTVDAAESEETLKKLESIEGQALCLRALAKRKS